MIKRVLLIEENEDLGGSWKLIKLPNGSVIEDACHLLEWYHRGYDVLAKQTGCKFVPMDPSPQQLNRSGKLVPYLSRSEIVKSMFLNTFGLCVSIIRLMFPGSGRAPREWKFSLMYSKITNSCLCIVLYEFFHSKIS